MLYSANRAFSQFFYNRAEVFYFNKQIEVLITFLKILKRNDFSKIGPNLTFYK